MTLVPLAPVFQFIYIHARSCFALIGGNLTAQWTGSHMGIEEKFQGRSCKLSLFFLARRQSAKERHRLEKQEGL